MTPEVSLVLLSTSPRVPTGLLSTAAWVALQSAGTVRAAAGHPLLAHLVDLGPQARLDLRVETDVEPRALARRLAAAVTENGGVVWLVGADGDGDLGRALGELAEAGQAPPIEILPGSYDLPGARLLDLVAVMDRLRSPGGCPWDAEQTHASLSTYLLEETHETLEAIDTGDRDHLREELGDLLLQVVFHARVAAEHPVDAWTVDDVAEEIVAKLVRRHPHVFGSSGGASGVRTAGDVEAGWELSKAAEKGRTSAVDGVPMALPALALATKLVHRAERNGVGADVVDPVEGDDLGARLMALVVAARAAGQDPETALRISARRYADRVRAAEQAATTE